VLYIKFLSFLKTYVIIFLSFLNFWSIGILLIFMNKILASFIIDISRCCFCGFCVEACPEDAIRMDTMKIELASYEREYMKYDKEKLLILNLLDK